MGKRKINNWYLFLTLIMLISCNKEIDIQIPAHYEGYALLQTKNLPDDGADLFTFYFLPYLKENHLFEKTSFNQEVSNKAITFIFPQGNEYTDFKIRLITTGWDETDEDLILVKLSYNMLVSDWGKYTNVTPRILKINDEVFEIEDYDFYSMADNNGHLLYKINDLEYIKKIN